LFGATALCLNSYFILFFELDVFPAALDRNSFPSFFRKHGLPNTHLLYGTLSTICFINRSVIHNSNTSSPKITPAEESTDREATYKECSMSCELYNRTRRNSENVESKSSSQPRTDTVTVLPEDMEELNIPEAHLNRKEKRKLRSRVRRRIHTACKKVASKCNAVDLSGYGIIAKVIFPAPPSTLDWVLDWNLLKTPLQPRKGDEDTQSICVCEDECRVSSYKERRFASEP
jgi:hypothetical protein